MNLNNQNFVNSPVPERIVHTTLFGNVDSTRGENTISPPVELDDPYHWMRSDDRKNEKVLEHLKLENSYTDYVMKDQDTTKDELYHELLSHIQETYDSYPLPNSDNGWDSEYYYFTRTTEGKSYPIHCRMNMKTQVVTELLDENDIAAGKT